LEVPLGFAFDLPLATPTPGPTRASSCLQGGYTEVSNSTTWPQGAFQLYDYAAKGSLKLRLEVLTRLRELDADACTNVPLSSDLCR
jgi:hypothetical protein